MVSFDASSCYLFVLLLASVTGTILFLVFALALLTMGLITRFMSLLLLAINYRYARRGLAAYFSLRCRLNLTLVVGMIGVVQTELGWIEVFRATLPDYLESLDLRLVIVDLGRLLHEHLVPSDEFLRE